MGYALDSNNSTGLFLNQFSGDINQRWIVDATKQG